MKKYDNKTIGKLIFRYSNIRNFEISTFQSFYISSFKILTPAQEIQNIEHLIHDSGSTARLVSRHFESRARVCSEVSDLPRSSTVSYCVKLLVPTSILLKPCIIYAAICEERKKKVKKKRQKRGRSFGSLCVFFPPRFEVSTRVTSHSSDKTCENMRDREPSRSVSATTSKKKKYSGRKKYCSMACGQNDR